MNLDSFEGVKEMSEENNCVFKFYFGFPFDLTILKFI
ncbi:MAG: hypothetical protein RL762_423 [Bacteroidota bacterium]|jgi:hypothetical protein